MNLVIAIIGIVAVVVALAVLIAIMLRVVVPTNMVHIVQSSTKTVPYGRGKDAGNTYYAIPSWIPKWGIVVTTFQESIFQIQLIDYEGFDSARLPFMIDVSAFFRIDRSEEAAQRVASFQELKDQLVSVLQGSVRRILATNTLETILESRLSLGEQFTQEVSEQLKEWGVIPVKTIEFLDFRDAKDSSVIKNIMAKEKSRIEKESRIAVAENGREAELKEIDAKRTVEVQKQDAEQQIGIRTAEKDKTVGIANQKAEQEVQTQQKVTTEREMEVIKVRTVKAAEIEKDAAIILAEQDRSVTVVNAEAEKDSMILKASGLLESNKLDAEGIRAIGIAEGEAEKAKLMAPVDAQITLAKEIGTNENYMNYLVTNEQIKASKDVGVEMAKAIGEAELKVIANSGDIQGGVASLGDMFTAKGGMGLGAMLSGLAQSTEGQALLTKFGGPVVPAAQPEHPTTPEKAKKE